MENHLYEFGIKIGRGRDDENMPKGLMGALVMCYAAAKNPAEAVAKGVQLISSMKHEVNEIIDNRVREIPVDNWTSYIETTWPDFKNSLPKSNQIEKILNDGLVFLSPFMAWEG